MLPEYLREILVSRLRAELAEREESERKVRIALEGAFEAVPGDRRFCIRRMEAMDLAARALGIRVVNNFTFGEVRRVAETLGWEAVKNGNRSLFRCVRRRGIEAEAALVLSRANRRDPRAGRSATRQSPTRAGGRCVR
jgi:hypothetical protein